MRRVSALLFGSAIAVVFGGCTFNPGPAGSGITASGAGGIVGSTGRAGSTGTGTGTGTGGSGEFQDAPSCGQHTYGTQNLPGDVLIVQDRSGSMSNNFNDQMPANGDPVKWDSMTAALNGVIANTQTMINWGITFYPAGSTNNTQCQADIGNAIAPAANNATPVANAIGASQPAGRTPTTLAVNTAVTYLNGLTDANPKYILLATDGQPNCRGNNANNTDDQGAIDAVAAAYNGGLGIPVFVVGVGNVAASENTLNSMAMAGGRAQATPDVDPATNIGRVYYPADNPAQLETALATISGQIKSCTFQLGAVPPDPTNIAVIGDNREIPKDPANGWSYGTGMTSVILNGTSCQQVMSGAIQQVQTIFGCPDMPIIIP